MKRLCLLLLCLFAIPAWAEEAPVMSWVSDGVLKVTYAGKTAEFTIPPLLPVQVTDEAYDSLPVYNTKASPYNRATALKSVWGANHGVAQAFFVAGAGKDAYMAVYVLLHNVHSRVNDGRIEP